MSMYHADMGSLAQFCGDAEYPTLSFDSIDLEGIDMSDPEEREVITLAMDVSSADRIRLLEAENLSLRSQLAERVEV